ncbi:hypothetical protein A2797_02065 [candidate division WWE3 bacterium RIFCSPHIGHO2_01_FULL_48_15]|uniref:Uncharacterized protein n=1 Tax=candidate division WWE3 bacterium RIFCSPHIGHO2_01_FULL_48_15 TaxID=1802619 RepID=A0A1F4VFR6_UNCKA|nr:MAG: hypothetical protein A2797_02065 [candidate division WWE3 bacterium RIFCSPHIGHO2_01_FULL_48_15]
MPESLPHQRPEPVVVGPGSPEKKQKVKETILGRFGEKHYDQLPEDKRKVVEALEYLPKRPIDQSAIEQSNNITNQLLSGAGLTPFDIPERNVHIIPEKLFLEMERDPKTNGTTFFDTQAIVLNADKLINPFQRSSTILHEIAHLKGFLKLQVEEASWSQRRTGLTIGAVGKKEKTLGYFKAFKGLDEAVVEEIVKRYLPRVLEGNPFLNEEYVWQISEEAQNVKTRVAAENGIDPAEIFWVSKDGKDFESFAYPSVRKTLYYLAETIQTDNPDRFPSQDEVIDQFIQAHFNGRILNLAHLVEGSFGKDSFRILSLMRGTESGSAYQVHDYLRKQRRLR